MKATSVAFVFLRLKFYESQHPAKSANLIFIGASL